MSINEKRRCVLAKPAYQNRSVLHAGLTWPGPAGLGILVSLNFFLFFLSNFFCTFRFHWPNSIALVRLWDLSHSRIELSAAGAHGEMFSGVVKHWKPKLSMVDRAMRGLTWPKVRASDLNSNHRKRKSLRKCLEAERGKRVHGGHVQKLAINTNPKASNQKKASIQKTQTYMNSLGQWNRPTDINHQTRPVPRVLAILPAIQVASNDVSQSISLSQAVHMHILKTSEISTFSKILTTITLPFWSQANSTWCHATLNSRSLNYTNERWNVLEGERVQFSFTATDIWIELRGFNRTERKTRVDFLEHLGSLSFAEIGQIIIFKILKTL